MPWSQTTIQFWRGALPNETDLNQRVAKKMRIVRKDASRVVSDPWERKRQQAGEPTGKVKVRVERVVRHVALQIDGPAKKKEFNRWHYIPTIIPTIKNAVELYERTGVRTNRTTGQSYTVPERTYFAEIPVRHSKGKTLVATLMGVEPSRTDPGLWDFRTLYILGNPANTQDAKNIQQRKRKAGALIESRPLVNPAYIGTWDAGRKDRAAPRLPGAAPALTSDSTTNPSTGKTFLLVGALVGLAYLANRLPRAA